MTSPNDDERRNVCRLEQCRCGAQRVFSAGLTAAEARARMVREGWERAGDFFRCPQCVETRRP